VITDEDVYCDLTYQEAKQIESMLMARDIKGCVVTTNSAGKRAKERGHVRTAEDN